MFSLSSATVAIAFASALPGGFSHVFNVKVGPNNQPTFQPRMVNASNGDIINFIM
jgi:hypothetical protein